MAKTAATRGDHTDRCQHQCQARCCRYITLQIDAPKRKCDFDELSWFLAHENVAVYRESRRWHVEVQNRCKYLTEENLCGAYENRPEVCRSYDAANCEYPARPKHELQFDTREQFDAWWARKKAKAKQAAKKRKVK
jgi:uncharacterized protein